MKGKIKSIILSLWMMESHIRFFISLSKCLDKYIPLVGKALGMLVDRFVFVCYGVDMTSSSINVKVLSISHPGGVLLGGNGICSKGRVVVMSGVKFGGKSISEEYLLKHAAKRVFELGDNVVIGTNSVILGPLTICDNVIIASMSLVNKSITEPGVYAGVPAKKISSEVDYYWVSHL